MDLEFYSRFLVSQSMEKMQMVLVGIELLLGLELQSSPIS